MTNERCIGRGL